MEADVTYGDPQKYRTQLVQIQASAGYLSNVTSSFCRISDYCGSNKNPEDDMSRFRIESIRNLVVTELCFTCFQLLQFARMMMLPW
jgi:hypothetical protein